MLEYLLILIFQEKENTGNKREYTQLMNEIKRIIENIIQEVPKDYIFDSHFVINQIIKTNSDAYNRFTAKFDNPTKVTLPSHGHIGQLINSFTEVGIIKMVGKGWSENIHQNASECHCYRKI